MTSIDFYTGADDPLDVAARIVAKAWRQHGHVRVLTPDPATTAALDRRLWTVPATGFLPHCRLASPLAAQTPILVDDVLAWLRDRGCGEVEEVHTAQETLIFALPPELRRDMKAKAAEGQ